MKSILILSSLMVAQIVVGQNKTSLYDIPLKDIDGKDTSLKAYQGKVLLVVNVASQCGFTPQYKTLEAVHRKYKEKAFTVLGFPCNDFGAQEPGTHEEIKKFCSEKYEVTFPLFAKLHVNGKEQHSLFSKLTGTASPCPGEIKWNFGKFLVGKEGKILKRFEPPTKPDAPEVIEAIEAAVAGK